MELGRKVVQIAQQVYMFVFAPMCREIKTAMSVVLISCSPSPNRPSNTEIYKLRRKSRSQKDNTRNSNAICHLFKVLIKVYIEMYKHDTVKTKR